MKDAPGANTLHMDKVLVYEAAHSSRVQKHLDRVHLTGVSSTDLDGKDDGRFAVKEAKEMFTVTSK